MSRAEERATEAPGVPAPRAAGPAGTRAAEIAAAIETAVTEHRLAPGTKLSEDQIGAIFGASRTIVRAALQALAHNHIVDLARHRGAHVACPGVAEARHLFGARRLVETDLVRRAAARMTPAGRKGLERLIRAGADAMAAADRGRAIRLSGEFHLAVAGIAAQPILAGFLAELISRTSLVIALYGRGRLADCGEEEHPAGLAARAAGDGEAAAAGMTAHLDHIEADLDLTGRSVAPVSLAEALGPPRPRG